MARIDFETLDALDAGCDIYGNAIHVGAKVRSFDFACWDEKTHEATGIQTSGPRTSYVLGEVVGYEEINGVTHYVIAAEAVGNADGTTEPCGGSCKPPVNGTPQLFSPYPTFGVVAVGKEG